ncbi:MAG: succinate dehydrogenase assembly factor 2 [Gammaproteobacteria bacterium]|nr:succinate dehydrogenase assembly factor 2 [Gammaproteobacteria bacterium]
MQTQTAATELNRLRWQCRRGMRELDLLLLQFLDSGYADLDANATHAFTRLLDCPDALLLEWLLGRQRPSDKDVADVVQRIRRSPAA